MADTSGKAFWSDLSKKTGTWTAVAALAVALLEVLDWQREAAAGASGGAGRWHIVAVLGAAVSRAIIGLSGKSRRP